jgi:hypothetical protein
MGWARTLLLGDIGNRLDIADVERDNDGLRRQLTQMRAKDRRQDRTLEQLAAENDQLELCVAALVKTLQRKEVFSAQEVENLVRMLEG